MSTSKKPSELTYTDFRSLAKNPRLSRNEKIDFPDLCRTGYTAKILSDITDKLQLGGKSRRILCDIGCGCGDLTLGLCRWTRKHRDTYVLVDSPEMLSLLPDWPNLKKFPGKFPNPALLRKYKGKAHAILCYSVLQYIYGQDDIFSFIKNALELLTRDGILLLGDIPNEDKRDRFLRSPEGKPFRKTLGRDRTGKIGDAVILSLLTRFRRLGYETYLLPQAPGLPMANRREDIAVVKRI